MRDGGKRKARPRRARARNRVLASPPTRPAEGRASSGTPGAVGVSLSPRRVRSRTPRPQAAVVEPPFRRSWTFYDRWPRERSGGGASPPCGGVPVSWTLTRRLGPGAGVPQKVLTVKGRFSPRPALRCS